MKYLPALIVLIALAFFGWLGWYSYQYAHQPSKLSRFIDAHPTQEEQQIALIKQLYGDKNE